MASSLVKHNADWSKEFSQSAVITERYFYLVFTKYGTPFPEDASWKEMKNVNGHWQIVQEVASMLFEIADLFEDARVEELVKKCKKLRLNSGNIYSQFIGTITTLLDNEITWGKVIVFFSFSVSFTIYLCTNEMGHLAARVCVWAAQVLQDRLQPWIGENGGWESLLKYGREALLHRNGTKHTEAMKKLGQASLVLGVFAVAAFTIKQLFS